MIARVAALGLLLAVCAALPAHASAQDRPPQIRRYDVTVLAIEDGRISVRESIDFDFGDRPSGAIARRIPVRFFHDPRHDRVLDVDVSAAGAAPPRDAPSTHPAGDDLVIELGSGHTGRRTFELLYTVRGAVIGARSHDELRWEATGFTWKVPTRRVDVTIMGPGITGSRCLVGTEDEARPCAARPRTDPLFHYTVRDVAAREGVTVVAAFPPGSLGAPEPIIRRRWSLAAVFALTPLTLTATALVALVTVGGVAALLLRRERDRAAVADGGAVQVEFRPPDDLRPAEAGVLLDQEVNERDVSATIVDLAVRGHLRIEQIADGRGPDWRLVPTPNHADPLAPFERTLLRGLFGQAYDIGPGDEPTAGLPIEPARVSGLPTSGPNVGRLQMNDVIRALDGQPVSDGLAVSRRVASSAPGTTFRATVERVGEQLDVPLQVTTHPRTGQPSLGGVRLWVVTPGNVGIVMSILGSAMPAAQLVERQLYDAVTDRGYFEQAPDLERRRWRLRGFIALDVSITALVLAVVFTGYALIALPPVIASAILLSRYRSMPVPTPAGREALRRVRGFREFITTADAGRLKFAEQENVLARTMPYAVVFGVANKWAEVLRGVDLGATVGGWFVPTKITGMTDLSQALAQFAHAVALASATPTGEAVPQVAVGAGAAPQPSPRVAAPPPPGAQP